MINTDVHSPEIRSYNMSRIRGKNTKPEVKVRALLHRAGFRFRIHDKRLPGKPDIVLPRYRAVIFVNGCFWHRHTGCRYCYFPKSRHDFWEKKFAETIKRDHNNHKQLQDRSWRVFIIWECELKNNPESIISNLILQFHNEVV